MIRPLDLQTLYMNLDKVGKEAAQSRDNVHNQQLAEGQKLTRDAELVRHAVAKTETGAESGEASSGKVKDEGEGKGQGAPRKRQAKKDAPEPEAAPDGFTDERLGRHIDLTG